jgi:hypothetical protein
MSEEEKGRSAPRNGPEQQDTPEVNPLVAVDQAMWIDDLQTVNSLTIPDATDGHDVTITAVPSDVLAANVAAMNAYAVSLNVRVLQGPVI